MKDLRGTYVRRSDVERRRRRARAVVMVVGLVTAGAMAAHNWAPIVANAEPVFPAHSIAQGPEVQILTTSLEKTRNELALADGQIERWNRIFNFSRRFHVDEGLSALVYDAALGEGIDPELAFPLVRLESEFKATAVSSAGALGLTQLMLPTARFYEKDISRAELLKPEANLRIGFRYLRDLIREHRNVHFALLAYNRGPAAVAVARELGMDPSNGYDRIVLKSYHGKGVVE